MHNFQVQLRLNLSVLIRGLDIWQLRVVKCGELESRVDICVVRAPHVKPPLKIHPERTGPKVAIRGHHRRMRSSPVSWTPAPGPTSIT